MLQSVVGNKLSEFWKAVGSSIVVMLIVFLYPHLLDPLQRLILIFKVCSALWPTSVCWNSKYLCSSWEDSLYFVTFFTPSCPKPPTQSTPTVLCRLYLPIIIQCTRPQNKLVLRNVLIHVWKRDFWIFGDCLVASGVVIKNKLHPKKSWKML